MPQNTKQKKDAWKYPSEAQELSHRTILRFQQLANELRDDVNRLPLFRREGTRVLKVLFVSCDPYYTEISQRRFYNYRLCETYDFPDPVWKWLLSKDNFGNPNINRFEPLFEVASGLGGNVSMDSFRKAVLENKRQEAHEQLIDAISVVPYRGVLLDIFEREFGDDTGSSPLEDKSACRWFWGSEKSFNVQVFDEFVSGKQTVIGAEQGEMTFHNDVVRQLKSDQAKKQKRLNDLRQLFEKFINQFTRGSEQFAKEGEEWPYLFGQPDFNGFVVPAYDSCKNEKQWQGGMAGWTVFIVSGKPHKRKPRGGLNEKAEMTAKFNWTGFTQSLRPFVRRVREARLRELLEEFTNSSIEHTVEHFYREHIQHLIGWKYAVAGKTRVKVFKKDGASLEFTVGELMDTKLVEKGEVPKHAIRLCQQFFEGLELMEARKHRDILIGETSHARAVNQAISHEFKKIVPLIPDAHSWLLQHIKNWLLAFALPGLSALKKTNDKRFLPSALYGQDKQTYSEWIKGLSFLASEIESVAIPGSSSHLPSEKEALQKNVERVTACFVFDKSLEHVSPSESFAERCILGTAILCVLRNCIQHTTQYKVLYGASGIGNYGSLSPKSPDCKITCAIEHRSIADVSWGEWDLVITNPHCDDKFTEAGGSEGAIKFYLNQIAEGRHITKYPFQLPFEPENNAHKTRLPALLPP